MDMLLALRSLAQKRPVFYSEADFQHALAWEIQKHYPESKIRLEYPVDLPIGIAYLDILVVAGEYQTAIELKYKTANTSISVQNEEYTIKNHSARDTNRYDYLRDIERLELFCMQNANAHGISVFLTNDPGYWKPPSRPDTIDTEFQLTESRILHGKAAWAKRAGPGTTKSRETPIHLKGFYPMEWREYSNLQQGRRPIFRFLCHSVT